MFEALLRLIREIAPTQAGTSETMHDVLVREMAADAEVFERWMAPQRCPLSPEEIEAKRVMWSAALGKDFSDGTPGISVFHVEKLYAPETDVTSKLRFLAEAILGVQISRHNYDEPDFALLITDAALLEKYNTAKAMLNTPPQT